MKLWQFFLSTVITKFNSTCFCITIYLFWWFLSWHCSKELRVVYVGLSSSMLCLSTPWEAEEAKREPRVGGGREVGRQVESCGRGDGGRWSGGNQQKEAGGGETQAEGTKSFRSSQITSKWFGTSELGVFWIGVIWAEMILAWSRSPRIWPKPIFASLHTPTYHINFHFWSGIAQKETWLYS